MTTLGVTSEIARRKETSGKFPTGSDCSTAQLHFPYQQKTIKSFNAKLCLKQRQQLSGKPQGWSPVKLCPVRNRRKMRKPWGREQEEAASLLLYCRKVLLVHEAAQRKALALVGSSKETYVLL